ncbi:MAG: hypothetical protein JSU06_09835 [Actinobacteria bacterium]|nr:hypothetical protein [Actinomycetota bacterium]
MSRLPIFLVALAALVLPATAQATTIVVDTTLPEAPGPACGLTNAVAAADSNEHHAGCPAGEAGTVDRIVFDLPSLPATITLASKLQIAGDVEILGPGAGQLTVSGGSTTRIFEALSGTISIDDLTVTDGRTTELGGGMYVQSGATVALDRVALRGNEVEATSVSTNPKYAAGGAIMNEGDLTLTESSVTGNVARNAATVAEAHALGGGIANGEGRLLLDRSTVSGNSAIVTESTSDSTAKGGGIYNLANLRVRDSALTGNEAKVADAPTNTAVGGGILFEFEGPKLETTIEGSTIAGNTATAESLSEGGGVAGLGLPATVKSSTLADNSATTGSNVFATVPVSFTNTIVARPAVGVSCIGALTSLGFNLDEGSSCGFAQPGDQSGVDPRLATTLADNGGPTQTLALLRGSPAIDSGLAPGEATDQRGFERPVDIASVPNAVGSDGTDIGAFEVQLPRVTITGGPGEGQTIAEAAPTFEFRADRAGAEFRCAFDGAAPSPCSSPLRSPELSEGAHTFSVFAIDEDGYVGPASTRTFRVDLRGPSKVQAPPPPTQTKAKKAPRVRIGAVPPRTTKRRVKIRFAANQAGSTFRCKLDGRRWRSCRSPYTTPRLSVGAHVFAVEAIGPTGLLSPHPATRRFRVLAPASPG